MLHPLILTKVMFHLQLKERKLLWQIWQNFVANLKTKAIVAFL